MGGHTIGILLSVALAVTACSADGGSAAAFAAAGLAGQETALEDMGKNTAAQEPEALFIPEFTAEEIPDEVFARMSGKSWPEGCPVSREELRYLRLSYVGFDGLPHTGEMIANEAIAEDLVEIFGELYEAGYPIEKIGLIDDYGADDEAAMEDNNTSCFNFRTIAGSKKLSNHSMGLAVDINPLYNPYIKVKAGETLIEPATALPYADREASFPYKIQKDDLCCRLFTEHGFTWGGDWKSVKDYQHFEKTKEN